jgi:hypothetical protein
MMVGATVALLGGAGAMAADTSSSYGDMKETMERDTSSNPADIRKVKVTVRDVDKANHKVTLEAKVSPEASITSSGERIKIDQLQPGDSIRASFDARTNEVVKVEVVQKASGSTAPMNP